MLTSHQEQTLVEMSVCLSAISCLSSLFLLFCYYRLNIRGLLYKLVFWMTINDIGMACGQMLGAQGLNNDISLAGCRIQGFIIGYFSLASVVWSMSISYTLNRVFVAGDFTFYHRLENGEYSRIYGCVCQVLPFCFAILPAFTDGWGETGGWCWIRDDRPVDTAFRFLTFYIWCWFALGYDAYVYLAVLRQLPDEKGLNSENREGDADLSHIKKMIYFPLALVAALLFATINRLYEILWEPVFSLNILEVFFLSLLGFWNFLAYGATLKNKIVDHFFGDQNASLIKIGASFEIDAQQLDWTPGVDTCSKHYKAAEDGKGSLEDVADG